MSEQREAEEFQGEPGGADVAWETRWGRVVGPVTIAALIMMLASRPVASRGISGDGDAEQKLSTLQTVGGSGSTQLIAAILGAGGVLLLLPFAFFMYRAIRARNITHPRFVPYLGLLAFALVAATSLIDFHELRDAARAFVASGPESTQRATQVFDGYDDGGLMRVVNVARLVAGIIFGIWISINALESMRVGLTTRFLGIFGLGAGLVTAVGIPIALALFLTWAGSVAVLAAGYWPGGRPLAWAEGRAVTIDEQLRVDRPRSGRSET